MIQLSLKLGKVLVFIGRSRLSCCFTVKDWMNEMPLPHYLSQPPPHLACGEHCEHHLRDVECVPPVVVGDVPVVLLD